jgi:signal transduction histidine kinase
MVNNMRRGLILIGVLLCFHVGLFSQDKDAHFLKLRKNIIRCLNENLDSAMLYAEQMEKDASNAKRPDFMSIAFQYKGKILIRKEEFSKATGFFIDALRIEEVRKDEEQIAEVKFLLGYIFYLMEKYEKSKGYYEASLEYYLKSNDSLGMAKTYSHLGNLESSREYCETRTIPQKAVDYNKGIDFYRKSMEIAHKIGDKEGEGIAYNNIGNTYRKLEKPDLAISNLLKAKQLYAEIHDTDRIIGLKRPLSMVYTMIGQHQKAISELTECIDYSLKNKQLQGIQFLYEDLAYIYERAGDYKRSKENYVIYMTIRDSIYNSEKTQQIFELETRYKTAEQEKQIMKLTAQKKLQRAYLGALAVTILLLLGLGYFIYRALKNKKVLAEKNLEIQQQRLVQLEKDHKILASQLIIQGEETERKRLARDLHDGLGGMLSGVKLSLSSMKGNAIVSEQSVKEFDHALDLLDASIKELRRVAHSMMPEALIRSGLKDALSDFCSSLNESCPMNISFQFAGTFQRVKSELEINCFRIVQELINNALKHSQATELVVQMIQEPERLCLIVQDNGVGFDPEIVKQQKGMGIASVKSRIELMNGTIDVASNPGQGAEYTIEFSL